MKDGELITQLSIFVNNEPGSLASIALVLKECDINLKAFNIAESAGFGVLRAIADDPRKACASLRGRSIAVKPTKVIAVHVEDQPGGLFGIARILGEAKINIEYAYAYAGKKGPVIFVRVDEPEAALAAIRAAGMKVLGEKDL
ncbi:MAG: ACT domain-containing protein [Thermoplasmatales archaeon]|nr:ACT domain-containing protein [Thermoplasmatales archaeon]